MRINQILAAEEGAAVWLLGAGIGAPIAVPVGRTAGHETLVSIRQLVQCKISKVLSLLSGLVTVVIPELTDKDQTGIDAVRWECFDPHVLNISV